MGGRGTHPVTAVAGGITFALDEANRRVLEGWTAELLGLVEGLAATIRDLLFRQLDRHPSLRDEWVLPLWSMGTVRDGALDFYDGRIRMADENGQVRVEFDARDYAGHLEESTLDWSYMKPVFGIDGGERFVYRVGPLARLNVADRISHAAGGPGTAALAGGAWADRSPRRSADPGARHRTDLRRGAGPSDRARPEAAGPARVPVKFSAGRGVGHVEAPRGTLFHDYEIDERGIVRSANLIIATQQNYDAINRSIAQAARSHVLDKGDAALLNAVEFAIRCYDPCLSCATHALGRMPLDVAIRRRGEVVRRLGRSD